MKASEIRSRFVQFFRERGHTVCPGDSLVPANDPSLLFTGAGMNQFKDRFLGVGDRSLRRATTVQKCLRTGDLDNVGRTAYHLTFFEMLGNFSFGDYFKEEAISWAWEFLTEVMGFAGERLAVSVYEDDGEAYRVWKDKIGLPAPRIFRFGPEDNFWPANAPAEGPNGPCGPCSEIFYDFDPGGDPRENPSTSGRFAEIWNLVFTQFERRPDGSLDPLPRKNIDTGMGFERLVAVHNGQQRVSETELFLPLLSRVARRAGRRYRVDLPEGVRIRRIADHIRAVTFCIADGVLPSNEGRGYVARRLIRRAINDGHRLGIEGPFLHELVGVVRGIMGEGYPEIAARADRIARLVQAEEERFGRTYERGLQILEGWARELAAGGGTALDGERAFQLYDTYGFPLGLAEQILGEQGLTVDREGFEERMEAQRRRARGGSKIAADIFDRGPLKALRDETGPTEFLGYEGTEAEGTVMALLADDERVGAAGAGARVLVVTDRTPFYAASGGQVGDAGTVRGEGGGDRGRARVDDTRVVTGLHVHDAVVEEGQLREGMCLRLEVDRERRRAIMRNHTATHLLHRALREVLGEHAEQAGSLVAPDRLRFDFTHPSGIPRGDLTEIEARVNRAVLADREVRIALKPYRQAVDEGAVALFGEKYGDEVRVVEIEGVSRELCGGTHVGRTGEIGSFRILSEGSIASGVRRIEAITGEAVLRRWGEERGLIRTLCERLKVPEDLLARKVEELAETARAAQARLERARRDRAGAAARDLAPAGEDVRGVRILARRVEGFGPRELRDLADRLRRAWKDAGREGVLLLASVEGGKIHLIAAATEGIAGTRVHAGDTVRELAGRLGGGGGGRADLAQGRGSDLGALDGGLAAVREAVEATLRGDDPAG